MPPAKGESLPDAVWVKAAQGWLCAAEGSKDIPSLPCLLVLLPHCTLAKLKGNSPVRDESMYFFRS